MQLHELLTQLSVSAWDFLEEARRAGFSPREETITENLLVEMHSSGRGQISIRKTTITDESKIGADFAWAIRQRSGLWGNFLIQAKKMNDRTSSYPLRGADARTQCVNLLAEAAATDALPLYLFYNGDGLGKEGTSLRFGRCCKRSLDRERRGPPWESGTTPAGCSLATAIEIEPLLWDGRARRPSAAIQLGMPWECLLCPFSRNEERPFGVWRGPGELEEIGTEEVPWVTEEVPAWADRVFEGREWEEDPLVPRARYYVVAEPELS